MGRQSIIARLSHGPKFEANFCHRLTLLHESCCAIESFYHEFDFRPEKKGNGFRSIVRITDLYFELLYRDITNGNCYLYPDMLRDHMTMSETLEKAVSLALILRRKGVDFDPTEQTPHDMDFFSQLFHTPVRLSEPITGSLGPFHYSGRMASHMYYAFLMLHYWKMPILTSARMAFDSRFSAELIASHMRSAPMNLVKSISFGRMTRATIYYVNCISAAFNGVYWKQIMIPNQSEWRIRVPDYKSLAVIEKTEKRVKNFRCLFAQQIMGKNDSRSLILHVHGGAFMTNTPEAFMLISTRLVKRTGVPVLVVEYAKAPENQFPAGLQDVLDFYISIVSGNPEVEKLIGFKPSRVFLSGDSCGGNLAIACLFALHNIRKMGGCVKMPSAVLTAYPACIPSFIAVPSYAHVIMDLVLSPGVMSLAGSMYSSIEPDIRHMQDWYTRHDVDHFEIVQKFSYRLKDPLFNVMAFTAWHDLRHIPLTVCSGEMDPLLDQSVLLAKRWAGEVLFDVVPGMPHGFTGFCNDPAFKQEIAVYENQVVRAVSRQ